MHENARKIAELITKYLYGNLDEEGARELDLWRQESVANQHLFERLTSGELLTSIHDSMGFEKQIFARIERKIELNEPETADGSVRRMGWRWLVAASLVLSVAIGSYMTFFSAGKSEVAKTGETIKNDVAPGSYKAKLQLADGRIIVLDSASIGELAKQGSVAIKNLNGQLVYDAQGNNAEKVSNRLSTNIGESYAIVLSDGSKIWLNSGSSIKYPVSFADNERVIEASGEIFLEVVKDARRPFRVTVMQEGKNKYDVEVLGTTFNVMAYAGEPIQTTLVEGKVVVTSDNNKKLLIPGQQASLNEQGAIQVLNDVDVDRVTAWKDQTFYFDDDDLKTIMRQLSRWYGIEAEYEGTIPDKRFGGLVSRNKNLSEVLKVFEQSGIRFRIEGKKVIFTMD
jgi:transmembrane sensor